jgi:hypothetical protein
MGYSQSLQNRLDTVHMIWDKLVVSCINANIYAEKVWIPIYIYCFKSITSTYDHRLRGIGLPLRAVVMFLSYRPENLQTGA